MNKLYTLLAASFAACGSVSAAWTTFGLADRVSFNSTAMAHLDDGRLVYAHDGAVYQQDAFGLPSMTSFGNAPSSAYSFVSSNGFLGVGSFGSTAPVYGFEAANTASSFTNTGSIQSFHGLAYTANSILVVGANGVGGVSEIGHYNTAGVYQPIVSNVSAYSAGITLDAAGNLFVVDNDDLNIYSFSATQVTAALEGATLGIGDGTLVTNLGVSGSIAVDSQGRVFVSGWQKSGVQVYDPDTAESGSILPNHDNTNYSVSTFSDGVNDYVGWLNWAGYSAGDAVTYGYDLDTNVPVPEPSAYGLFGGLLALLIASRRRVRI